MLNEWMVVNEAMLQDVRKNCNNLSLLSFHITTVEGILADLRKLKSLRRKMFWLQISSLTILALCLPMGVLVIRQSEDSSFRFVCGIINILTGLIGGPIAVRNFTHYRAQDKEVIITYASAAKLLQILTAYQNQLQEIP